MKKILALLGIFCLLVFSLGCGGGEAPEGDMEEAVEEVGEESQSLLDQAEETAEDAVEAGKDLADEAGDALEDLTD